jgi:predicted alpha/beta-hydrolase family hydrolase
MSAPKPHSRIFREVAIPAGKAELQGELNVPAGASGIVLFAHGSGSSRHSPRNQFVARTLHEGAVGTLLFDLLTSDEEEEDRYTAHLRFDIELLSNRLIDATRFIAGQDDLQRFPIGYFGSSTGAAAALIASVQVETEIAAIVSRGGRPDLAGEMLPLVKAPTLLIVGGRDDQVIKLNRDAYNRLHCEKKIDIVARATHLFEEPGALEEVAGLAASWFRTHFESRAEAT